MDFSVATKEQISVIKDLAYKIWPDTYGSTHSQEELDYMLTKFYSIESLENQINSGHIFILVGIKGFNLGFASYEINAENTTKTKIHKLYVIPQTQTMGIGKKTVNYIKNDAINHNNTGIFLNVNKHNNAQLFYQKCGFSKTKDIIIDIGNGYVMDDYVMEMQF